MSRWRMWTLVTLLVWIAIVAVWATRPVSDTVPTGISKKTNAETTQTVQCDSPLSGNTSPTEPLPELPGARAYERTPCETAIENDRTIFWVDVVLTLVAVVVLVKTSKPSPARDSDEVVLA